MLRLTLILWLTGFAAAAHGQSMPPESEDSRYVFHRVQDGFVRLDTRTGQAALCSRRAVGWACQAMPEDRAALEGEIARLQGENAALKKEMLARGLALPGGTTADPPAPDRDLKRPNAAELDRMVAFLEKAWRRLVEMMGNLQKDLWKRD
jgi:hypothetical protein